jgi:hypothetical protein
MSSLDKQIAFEGRMTRRLMFEQKLFKEGKPDWAKRALARRIDVGAKRFDRRFQSIEGLIIGRPQRLD